MNRENYHKVSFFEDICEVIIFFYVLRNNFGKRNKY